MLNLSDVQDSMEAMKREELLKKHQYKIWQGKDGKWYTYLPDESKKDGRRLIKRTTEKAYKVHWKIIIKNLNRYRRLRLSMHMIGGLKHIPFPLTVKIHW